MGAFGQPRVAKWGSQAAVKGFEPFDVHVQTPQAYPVDQWRPAILIDILVISRWIPKMKFVPVRTVLIVNIVMILWFYCLWTTVSDNKLFAVTIKFKAIGILLAVSVQT